MTEQTVDELNEELMKLRAQSLSRGLYNVKMRKYLIKIKQMAEEALILSAKND